MNTLTSKVIPSSNVLSFSSSCIKICKMKSRKLDFLSYTSTLWGALSCSLTMGLQPLVAKPKTLLKGSKLPYEFHHKLLTAFIIYFSILSLLHLSYHKFELQLGTSPVRQNIKFAILYSVFPLEDASLRLHLIGGLPLLHSYINEEC